MSRFGQRPGDRERGQSDRQQRSGGYEAGGRPQRGGDRGRRSSGDRQQGASGQGRAGWPRDNNGNNSSGGNRGGDRPRYGDQQRGGNSGNSGGYRSNNQGSSDRPRYGDRDQQRSADRPSYGDRNQRSSGDRPRYNNDRDQQRGNSGGGYRSNDRDQQRGSDRNDRSDRSDRSDRNQRRSSGERPRYNNDRDQARNGTRSDRPRYGDQQRGSGGSDRPRYGDRNDRNQRSSGDRPRYNNDRDQQRGNSGGGYRANDRPRFNNRDDRSGGGYRPRPDRDGDDPRNGESSRPQRPTKSTAWQDRSNDRPKRFDGERKPRTKPQRGGDQRQQRDVRPKRTEERPLRAVVDETPGDDQAVVEQAVVDQPIVEQTAALTQEETGEEVPEPTADRFGVPTLPEGAEFSALDAEARMELRSLPKSLAEVVGSHLVAAGMLVDDEPERALLHARFARAKAARVGLVREAAGLTAYHAGEWAEALSELRAARRMSNGPGHLAVMADCERALGRPERALELAKEASTTQLTKAETIELRIVSAGARRDMGQLDAAVVALQGADLDPARHEPWSARLFYAYADNLAAAGRTEEAVRWFMQAAEFDDEEETDASERAIELSQGELADPAETESQNTEAGNTEAGNTEAGNTEAGNTGAGDEQ